jgi:hypothetical protein
VSTLALAIIFGAVAAPFVIVPPLLATLAIELPVAAAFRIGKRGMLAVFLVNVVTNPVFNAALFALYGFGIGIHDTYLRRTRPGPPTAVTQVYPVYWFTFAVMEVAIALVEWGLLVWALRRTAGSARKLLAMSVCMNAASALLALWWSLQFASRSV